MPPEIRYFRIRLHARVLPVCSLLKKSRRVRLARSLLVYPPPSSLWRVLRFGGYLPSATLRLVVRVAHEGPATSSSRIIDVEFLLAHVLFDDLLVLVEAIAEATGEDPEELLEYATDAARRDVIGKEQAAEQVEERRKDERRAFTI